MDEPPLLTVSHAWWPPTAASFVADIVTFTVADAPPASVTLDEPSENDTPVPVVPAMPSVQVTVPAVVLRMVTGNVLVWPEPDGTAPKLTLTGDRTAVAVTALSRFSRPAPPTFTSVTMVVPFVKALRTPASAVLTI